MALTVGDKFYSSAEMTPFSAYRSGSPISHLLGNCLEQAYFSIQNDARVLQIQPYGYDMQDLYSDVTNVNRYIKATTSITLSSSYALIPDETSHVGAIVIYQVAGAEDVRTDLDLLVTNNVVTDASSVAGEEWKPDYPSWWIGRYTVDDARLFSLPGLSLPKISRTSVALSSISPAAPGTCRIEVSIRVRELSSTGYNVDAVFMPHLVIAYAEMRY